jgi:hypothetical protein
MYAYYRNTDMIQTDLFKTLQGYVNNDLITIDSDFPGFSDNSFDPLLLSAELLGLFESDREFKESAILHYQIAQALTLLGIKDYDLDSTIDNYWKGLAYKDNFEAKFGPDCWPNVKPVQIMYFQDSGKDLELLRAYIGIKSIIGFNNYVSTHKTIILSRILGCKSNESLHSFIEGNASAKEFSAKFSGRKRMDNLLYKLMERGFMMMLSKKHESRIYVSTKLKTPEELAEAILKNRKQNDLKKRAEEASKLL